MAGFDNEVMFALGERLQASTAQAIQLMQQTATDVSNINHTGDPNGVVAANPSSISHDPISGNIYVKVTGTGNTGWQQIVAGNVVITADDGNSLTTSPYDIFGQKAGVVPVNSTAITAGQLFVANNTWQTQYVVDASTTLGLEGTFQTIQSAIDQAVIDGASLSVEKKIFIRYGSYTENLNIPAGIYLEGDSIYLSGGLPQFTTITGNHNVNSTNIFRSQGINFLNIDATADTFTGSSTNLFFFNRCEFQNTGTGLFFTMNFNSSIITSCIFSAPAYLQPISITSGSTGIIFDNCLFTQCGFTNEGSVTFLNCQNIGPITCVGGSANVTAYNCLFNSNPYCINGTGNGLTLTNCTFNANSTDYPIQYTGQESYLVNCNILQSTPSLGIYDGGCKIGSPASMTGNIYTRHLFATDTTAAIDDFYIGITDTSVPRTVNLQPSSGLDRTWIVKDESLAAGTNNITVVSASGLIDGAASYVINTNGGAAQFIADGAGNYFVMNEANALSPGSSSINTITGNSGGAESPLAGNFNILGTGSITVAGSANTETVQLTGLTNHNILVGSGTATITNVAPSATSGIPLVSNGASSDPSFTTAVVAGGGTGQVTLTNHGVLVGQATSPIASTAAGNVGQILQSGGASANPAYSTATYPSTAGTSGKILISDGTNIVSSTPTYPNLASGTGKILRADGTNWVASTATYPDLAGTSGNVLTSDGTNWTSAAISSSGAITTITGNSGGAETPSTGNFNILGTGSITVAGSVNTETVQLTGLTNHNLLVGAGTATITNVAPSSTSGIPVISQGTSADPVYGTAVVAGGGTGQVTLTNHGVLIGQATSAIVATAAGTAGQVLQSGGASANPAYSTATYPSTAGTNGNILTSNGTNWISSAPAASSGLITVTGQLTSLQIKSLHATPIQVIAAPGSGKFIRVISCLYSFVYGGSNVFVAGSSQTVSMSYGVAVLPFNLTNAMLTGSSNTFSNSQTINITAAAPTNYDNQPLNMYNNTVTEISGNAANDNVINFSIVYLISSF